MSKTKKKTGLPNKFTPDELLKLFDDYVETKGFRLKNGERFYMPISIVGFHLFLGVNSEYIYQLKKESYGEVIGLINLTLEDHINNGIACGDLAQSWGIFYLKNKFGYRDVKQIEADVKQEITNNIIDIDDEELTDILNG